MIRRKKTNTWCKRKAKVNETTILRRNRHNSEKLGELTLRFENLDTAAIKQKDMKEEPQKLNDCQEKIIKKRV